MTPSRRRRTASKRTPATVAYGYYWAAATPALRIASGDVIDVDTLLTNSPAGLEKAGVPPEKVQASLRRIVAEVTGDRRGPGGHILTGPVFVEGAEPGDVLEVKVLSIDLPIDYGYNGCAGFLPENCDRSVGQKIVAARPRGDDRRVLSRHRHSAQAVLRQHGRSAASRGGPGEQQPAEPFCRQHGQQGAHRRRHPVISRCSCPGALFAVGDGHAAQGDGEVDQTAIETSLRGRLQLTVRKGERLNWPRAETATDYISMGADPDLAVATKIAIQEMVDFLARTRGLTTHQAYQLVSVAGNVAVTQLVDKPTMGVHVKMPKSIFK